MSDEDKKWAQVANQRLNNMRQGDLFNPWLAMKQQYYKPNKLISGTTVDERLRDQLFDETYTAAESAGREANMAKQQIESGQLAPEQLAKAQALIQNPAPLPISWVKQYNRPEYDRRTDNPNRYKTWQYMKGSDK